MNDDAVLDRRNHLLKLGVQFRNTTDSDMLTNNFNGSYIFGVGTVPMISAAGSAIPGETVTIAGGEQYRRSSLNLPGGTATAFSKVIGMPKISFNSICVAL